MARVSYQDYATAPDRGDEAFRNTATEIDYGGGTIAKRGQKGWKYDWRDEEYQDVLNEKDISQQQQLQSARTVPGLKLDQGDAQALNPAGQQSAPQSPAQQTTQAWANAPAPAAGAGGAGAVSLTNTPTSGQTAERSNKLFELLMSRATQPLTADPNDPSVRVPTDAYAAEEERARRNYLGDIAEESGPYANLRGEERMASERMGQRVGGFKAQMLGQALQAKRAEIAQALEGAAGMLSQDEQQELQMQLAVMDEALKKQGLGLQAQGMNIDWQKSLLNNDMSLRQLGLNEWDRTNYWDAVRSGAI